MSPRYRLRLVLLFLALLAGVALAWRHEQRRRAARPVPIEEGKTIDFSSGRAVVRDSSADRAALEAASREMDEAARDVTFAPTQPTPAATPHRDRC